MIYIFIVKGYYDCAYFDIQVKAKLDLENYQYVRFSSYESAKVVFKFYKEEVCQGGKPSKGTILSKTSFFDAGYKHWTEFESYNKSIVYQFSINNDRIIVLNPLNYSESYNLNESEILDL